jgi:lysine 2,3-aminomutase
MNPDASCSSEKTSAKIAVFMDNNDLKEHAPWPQKLRRGLVSLEQLDERGWLNQADAREHLVQAQEALDIRVPAAWHEGIQSGDNTLAKQVIPTVDEAYFAPEELSDPIGDETFSPCAGLTHRYRDRVLVKITYQCAMYCRFCFRRHKVSHAEENLSYAALQEAYQYIESHPEIHEVIFTGGDPLVLTDARLEEHIARVESIPHIETIRFHTRIPSALPERITPELCKRLGNSNKMVWVVVHINASSELNTETLAALRKLRKAGVGLSSQSVLLKGINDTEESLMSLFRGLYKAGVTPYYLHYPDLAKGTNHFRIPLERAIAMVQGLVGRLPGLAIPRLTVDIPGGFGKISVSSENLRQCDPYTWEFRSPLSNQWEKVQYPRC